LGRAREIWLKKFGSPPATSAEMVKQVRFLASRGFSQDSIWHVIKGNSESENPA
jgi:regulatory protein